MAGITTGFPCLSDDSLTPYSRVSPNSRGVFFLVLQSRTVRLQEIVFLEGLTEITGTLGNRPFGPIKKSVLKTKKYQAQR